MNKYGTGVVVHKEKEPAPVATDTSSERILPTDIISPRFENVKRAMMAIKPDFENAVKEMEAVMVKRSQPIHTPEWVISAAEFEIEAVGVDIDKLTGQIAELNEGLSDLIGHRQELQLWVSDVIKARLGAEHNV